MSTTQNLICAQCEIPVTNQYMKCSVCNACFHFSPCCTVQQATYSSMNHEKKSSWKCNKCRERKNSAYHTIFSNSLNKQKRNEQEEEDEVFDDNNKKFKEHTSKPNVQQVPMLQQQNPNFEINNTMQIMMQNISQMTTQLASISTQLQNQQTTLTQINENISSLGHQVIELQKQNQEKDKRMNEMEIKITKLEQQIIVKNIEINNVNNENLSAADIVEKIATNLSVELKETDIENAYRTKGKGNVVVEFNSLKKKREIMSKLKRHRMEATGINNDDNSDKHKYIYINDQLTSHKRRLLWLAKIKAKETNWKFVWVRNGEMYARKIENAAILNINSETDINKIC